MLLLDELIRKTTITTGQTTIPLEVFGYDKSMLSDIFEESIYEYEVHRPLLKRVIIPLDNVGFYMPDAVRIKSIRLHSGSFNEFTSPLDFRYWEFRDDKKLTCAYSGTFFVEYLSKYKFDYLISNQFNVNYVTEFDDQIKITLKDGFKKGTLNISLTNLVDTITYSVTDDLSSYQVYNSSFTVNILTDILTILEPVGKKLQTGSIVKLENTLGSLPSGVNSNDNYFVIKTSDTSIKLANSLFNAMNNISINFTDLGAGNNSIVSQVNLPLVNLSGALGTGTFNTENNQVIINLNNSVKGYLNVEFRTLNKGVQEISSDESLFMKLFKANFLISLGLNKSILKLDGLPWDFSVDDLIGRGEKMKEALEEKEMPDKSNWWNFR